MTDFSLGFSIDTSALRQASADAAKAASDIGKLGDAEERLGKSAQQAAHGQKEVSQATKDAEASAQRYLRSLEMEARATKEFERAQKTLSDALANGRINAQQHANYMRQVGDAYRQARTEADAFRNSAPQGGGLLGGLGGIQGDIAGLRDVFSGGVGGIAQGVEGAAGAFSRLRGALGPVGIGIGAVAVGTFALHQSFTNLLVPLAQVSDRFTQYQARINLVLKDQDAAAASMQRVIASANEAGVSIDAAVGGFERILRNKDALGASTEQIELLMSTVQKLGAISNTSQGEMQGAMIQFSQAIASGRLNGDELRSIMESMPSLAKAIADGLGTSVGNLRKMGAEGELTGDKVFKALLSQADKVSEDFSKLPDTTDRAMTRMANQWDMLKSHIADALNAPEIVRGILGIGERALEIANSIFGDDPVDEQVTAKAKELADAQNALAEAQERYNKAVANGSDVQWMQAGINARSQGIERLKRELQDLERVQDEQRSRQAKEEALTAQQQRDKRIADAVAKASEYDKDVKKQREVADKTKEFTAALEEAKAKRIELHNKSIEAANKEIEAAARVARAYDMLRQAMASGDQARIIVAQRTVDANIFDAQAAKKASEEAKGEEQSVEEQIRALGVGLSEVGKGDKKKGGSGKSAIQTLRESVADLRRAIAEETGGGIDMMLQALGAERDKKGTGAETRSLLFEQATLQAQRETDSIRRQTEQQRQLAQAVGSTGIEMRNLEIRQAASNYQHDKFGNQLGPKVAAAMEAYTRAIREQKEAADELAAANAVLDAQRKETLAWQMTFATGDPKAQRRAQFEAELEQQLEGFRGTGKQREEFERARRGEFTAREEAQQREISIAQEKQLKAAKERLAIATLATDEYEIQLRLLSKATELEAQGYRKGDGVFDETMAREESNARQEQTLNREAERRRKFVQGWERTADEIGGLMSDSFEAAYERGLGSAASVFANGMGNIIKQLGNQMVYEIAIRPVVELTKQLLAMAAQKAIASIIGGAFSGGGGSSGPPGGGNVGILVANGGVFGPQGYHAFAAGGAFSNSIVSSPTLFAFSGGTGLMGEAGPEAIMPLKRGANGKLGVEASRGDGGTTIVVNDMRSSPQSQPVETSEKRGPDGKRMISILIRDEVRRQIRSGDLDREMNVSYGATRTLARK